MITVSVPFNAGRGLMLFLMSIPHLDRDVSVPFNAGRGLMLSFTDQPTVEYRQFQYPSMRVVD